MEGVLRGRRHGSMVDLRSPSGNESNRMSPGILGFFGLSRRREVVDAQDRATAQKQRAADIQVRLEASQLEAERWKWKLEQLTAELKAATKERDRWKSKAGERNELISKLERLSRAEQNVALTRGHLLAMETKLDVIEGALNVLDQRTRPDPSDPSPDRE